MKTLVRTLVLAVALVLGFACVAQAEASAERIPISIVTEPTGGTVHLDHQRIGPAPVLDWAVQPGKHTVTITRTGRPDVTREIHVTKVTGQRFVIMTNMCAKCAAKVTEMAAACKACKKMGKMCPECTAACKAMCAKCAECQKLCGMSGGCGDCKSAKSDCGKCKDAAATH